MVKDLIKIADKLDSLGFHKEASEIDEMIRKTSGIFKSKAEGSKFEDDPSKQWFKKDIFDNVRIEAFVKYDYVVKKYKDKVVKTPDEYIKYMEIQPWQEQKIRRHIEAIDSLYNSKKSDALPEKSTLDRIGEAVSKTIVDYIPKQMLTTTAPESKPLLPNNYPNRFGGASK